MIVKSYYIYCERNVVVRNYLQKEKEHEKYVNKNLKSLKTLWSNLCKDPYKFTLWNVNCS